MSSYELRAGEYLVQNPSNTERNCLESRSRGIKLVLQQDGNLVLSVVHNGRVLWSSGTGGKAVSKAIMQDDGNFVIYGFGGSALWSSDTFGKSGSYLIVQDDGNLVIYQPVAQWSTDTVGK